MRHRPPRKACSEKSRRSTKPAASYLLRLPNADAKARQYARFVDDLKIAAELLRKSARAA
jgi:hypothetical protein